MEIKYNFETDIEPPNRGFTIHKCSAILNDEEIGYIKVCLIPLDKFKQIYKSILDFEYKIKGQIYVPYNEELSHKSIHYSYSNEEIVNYYNESGYAQYGLGPANSYNDLINKTYYECGKQFREFKNCHVDNPYVDYSLVKEEYRNKGIGYNLYLKTNEFVKDLGYDGLRQSTIQSKAAEGLWLKMERKGLAKVMEPKPKARWTKKRVLRMI